MSSRVAVSALQAFAEKCLRAAGSADEQAKVTAEVLTWCDSVGRASQGVRRLPVLCDRLQKGGINRKPNVQCETPAPAWGAVDGDAATGQFAGHRGIEHAMQLAESTGSAAVAVRNSNYYGAGGYFCWLAAEAGFVSLALSNSYPKVVAYEGSAPVLGTNPFAFGAPGPNGEHVLVDMATSAAAGSTVRASEKTGDTLTGPDGQKVEGGLTSQGHLLPAGGAKGYALAVMVEVLSGVLTGAAISHGVLSMFGERAIPSDSGHFFWVAKSGTHVGADDFLKRMEFLRHELLASGDAVRVPGVSRAHIAAESERDGIALAQETANVLQELALDLGVEELR